MEFEDIGFDDIELIKDLWERNRDYHRDKSEHFKCKYEHAEFHGRMRQFESDAKDGSKITIAENEGKIVGYCISTINDGIGEIGSLHVLETERGKGTGKILMGRHMEWLKEKKCLEIKVAVMTDNEGAIEFYRMLGFKPDILYMQLI